ncbi:DUF1792 domain-containing protein [Candidatus Nomurabacteria bacterium]|nr:DUF1792 domain-containing protein [Candidatus Nomurabacteria bacterium]
MNETELTEALQSGRSLIRFGDGEINLLLGLRNHYQTFSPRLRDGMSAIVSGYQSGCPYILSIPRFVTSTNDELHAMGKLQVWLPLKVIFALYFKRNLPYLDAHSFYYDGYFERVVGPIIASKHVILITKKKTVERQCSNKNIPWSKCTYVTVPSEESLDSYEVIEAEIDSKLSKIDDTDPVLLFAMGPVGKLLALKYAKQNVQSIDVGKVAEVMYTGESIAHII